MTPHQLSHDLFVSGQLVIADLDAVAEAGFATVVNNRPDGEAVGQPTSAQLEAQCARLGLSYRHLPVIPGTLCDATARAFASQLDRGGRALAFCRTGTRSASLWALARAGVLGPDAVIAAAARAGYDLDALRPLLEAAAHGRTV